MNLRRFLCLYEVLKRRSFSCAVQVLYFCHPERSARRLFLPSAFFADRASAQSKDLHFPTFRDVSSAAEPRRDFRPGRQAALPAAPHLQRRSGILQSSIWPVGTGQGSHGGPVQPSVGWAGLFVHITDNTVMLPHVFGGSGGVVSLQVDLPPCQSGKAEDARSKQYQRSRLGRRRGAEVEFKALGIAHIRSVAQEGVILAKPCQASGIGIDKPQALISRVQG